MLLTCSACNSRYLVNSADLKPKGRKTKCSICGNEWFQKPNIDEENIADFLDANSLNVDSNQLKQKKNPTYNLPSTYIKEEETSLINSLLVLIILFAVVFGIWFIQDNGIQIIALLNYYIQEFYFNSKLIINDLAKLIHQMIN